MGLGCDRSGGPVGRDEGGGAGPSRRNIWGIWGMLGICICGMLGSTLDSRLVEEGGGPRSELLDVLRLHAAPGVSSKRACCRAKLT